jgi:hypothetical protein
MNGFSLMKNAPPHGHDGARCCRAGNLQKQSRDGPAQIVLRRIAVCIRRNGLSIGLRGSQRLTGLALLAPRQIADKAEAASKER